ncbi:DUF6221 family protein [Streptomyces sp. Ac-502]|uniref:DUF6221 family protein n=1 Tax=Streptomyces sp. Ac-502 TaxID=3342801 RepID=UPI0038626097
MDLVQFLRDRLDEDEAPARAALGVNVLASMKRGKPAPRWVPSPDGEAGIWDTNGIPRVKFVWARERDHIIRHDPARVLAEVEAKRQAVDHYEQVRTLTKDHEAYILAESAVLRQIQYMALPYADHPDYRQEWRP